MRTRQTTYIIGDVHGQLKKLTKLLRDAHLVEDRLSWRGGSSVLWFIGDLVDRGPDSIAVMDLVMRLQIEASYAGGRVGCLLGNHELLMLGAYRFGRRSTGLGSNFITKWKQNGGNRKDLGELTIQHLDWLMQLPALARAENRLLLHADAPFYIRHGHTIDEVNTRLKSLLQKSDALAWEELIEDFARRGAFASGTVGEEFARRLLTTYGGEQLVHGHTPIHAFTHEAPRNVIKPLIYASNQCVNVDGGMFLGGPGFIYELPQATLG